MHSGSARSQSLVVGIHGGGNIGLGVLGSAFSETLPNYKPDKIFFHF